MLIFLPLISLGQLLTLALSRRTKDKTMGMIRKPRRGGGGGGGMRGRREMDVPLAFEIIMRNGWRGRRFRGRILQLASPEDGIGAVFL